MSPEDRETITTSIANLWSFNTMLIADLLYELRKGGLREERIESFLQNMDRHADVLVGESDQSHATTLLATVRKMLRDAGG
jgi:hypothetical protein